MGRPHKPPEYTHCVACGIDLPEDRRSDMRFCPPTLEAVRGRAVLRSACRDTWHNAQQLRSRPVTTTVGGVDGFEHVSPVTGATETIYQPFPTPEQASSVGTTVHEPVMHGPQSYDQGWTDPDHDPDVQGEPVPSPIHIRGRQTSDGGLFAFVLRGIDWMSGSQKRRVVLTRSQRADLKRQLASKTALLDDALAAISVIAAQAAHTATDRPEGNPS